jgi:PPOX class probable F420-dependent enzyme
MAITIPDTHLDLITGPYIQTLVTLMPDQHPQATPVWGGLEGEHLVFTTVRGRQKEKNLLGDPRLTILVVDPEDSLRYLEIRGEVVAMHEEGGVEKINEFARLYTDHSMYYGGFAPAERQQQEERILVKVRPVKIHARG